MPNVICEPPNAITQEPMCHVFRGLKSGRVCQCFCVRLARMTAQTGHSDIFDVIGQQAGARGLSARVEILRGVELLRAACARISLYAAVGALGGTPEDHARCTGGIERAVPSMHAALNLLVGTQQVSGVDPAALAWVRGFAAQMPDSCKVLRAFVEDAEDLVARHRSQTNGVESLRAFTEFAAGDFNLHFGKIMNALADDLQTERTAQKRLADTTGAAARSALVEISEVSRLVGLVAINASIEAAHVGDQGKGFAIIAGEIREMSKQIEQVNDRVHVQIDALLSAIENA